jgi:hypothetical protein
VLVAGGGIKKFVWLPVDRSTLVSGTKYWIVLNGDFPTTGGTNLIVLLSVSGGSGNGRLLEDAGWGGIVSPFWFKQYYHDGIGIDIDSVASMGNNTGTTLNLSHTNSGLFSHTLVHNQYRNQLRYHYRCLLITVFL